MYSGWYWLDPLVSMLIVGFIVAFLALYVEFKFQPPFWVHILLWLPLILILAVLPWLGRGAVLDPLALPDDLLPPA